MSRRTEAELYKYFCLDSFFHSLTVKFSSVIRIYKFNVYKKVSTVHSGLT